MKKSIIIMGIIVTIGSIALLYDSNKKEVLLNKEEITNNKSIAIYVKQEDGNYEKTNTIPESGYILNEEKSVCSNNSKPSWNINTKSLKINNLNSNNTSCYLYRGIYWHWTLSPSIFNGTNSVMFVDRGSNQNVSNGGAVAPVINLSAEYVKTLSGTGTMTDPYQNI